MTLSNPVLHVKVGETLVEAGSRAAASLRAVERGEAVTPYFGVSFEQIGQMLAAFTPKRWALIARLRQSGP